MSRELLQALHEARAFKPAPSLWELAATHVPFGELGIADPPEPRMLHGLSERDGVALLFGDSGAGKSSVLSYVTTELAGELTDEEEPHRYLPVFVPVVGQPAAGTLDDFGRAAMLEVLLALRDVAPQEARERIEAGMGKEVSTQRSGAKFNAKLAAKIFNAGPEMGIELGPDVVTIVREQRLDNRGGLKTLGDVVRAHGLELLIAVEDTDAWASSAEGEGTARTFFSDVIRPLAADVDVGVAIAVQSRWEALDEVVALRERAVSVATMPDPTSEDHARQMIEGILERRIRYGLGERYPLPDAPVREAFADDALAVLAHDLSGSGNFRRPLAIVRDTFDRHADGLPDQFEREHLLDSY